MPIANIALVVMLHLVAWVPAAAWTNVASQPGLARPSGALGADADLPATIDFPSIDFSAPVVAAQETMKDGARTWTVPCSRSASAIYSGGNTVLFGHRDVCGGVFDDLPLLRVGDEVRYDRRSYSVAETHVVVPTEVWAIRDFGDDRVTMISCWPPGSTAKRYVVIATRAEAPEAGGVSNTLPAPTAVPTTRPPTRPACATAMASAGTSEGTPRGPVAITPRHRILPI